MRRACLFSVLQLVAFTAAWYLFFRGRVEPPALFVFAAIAGLLGAIAVGLAWSVILRGRERRALARAVAGLPPEDGRLSAAAGRLQASGLRTLKAPFSGREALAYEYQVCRWKRTGTTRRAASRDQEFCYDGYGLVPCVVRTPTATVRLLGMPQMDELPALETPGHAAPPRAAEFLASTTFEEVPRTALRTAVRTAIARVTDDAEEIRRDIRIGEPVTDLSGWTLAERVIAPGEEVCVLGRFAADRGGLVPPAIGSGETLRVVPGDPATVARSLRRRMWTTAVVGGVALAAAHAVLLFVASVWEDRAGPGGRTFANRQERFEWAVQEGRVDVVERLAGKGIDPNRPGTFGTLPVHQARDAATLAALLGVGADPERRDSDGLTPLMKAANAGEASKVRVLLARRVQLEAETPGGFTAYQLASDPAVRRLLKEAGARDPDAELAAGEPLPPDGGEPWKVALAYLEAIGSGDEVAYRSLHARTAQATAMSAAAYRDARPHTGRFRVGRVRGDRAVLEAEGPMAGAEYSVIVYLAREDGAWRVLGSGLRQPDFDPEVPPPETRAER